MSLISQIDVSRREFLTALTAAAAIATGEVALAERIASATKAIYPAGRVIAAYNPKLHTYTLGFKVSQELLDDDLYHILQRAATRKTCA